MKKVLLFALVLSLLCTACGKEPKPLVSPYQLYYTTSASHGPALDCQPYAGSDTPDPGELLTALLAGPDLEGLTSPFPDGTALQDWDWDPEQPGNLRVWLSQQYSGLADISLSLADYAIVLTLSQLPDVETVEIFSEGHTVSYRSHQRLAAVEALLSISSASS